MQFMIVYQCFEAVNALLTNWSFGQWSVHFRGIEYTINKFLCKCFPLFACWYLLLWVSVMWTVFENLSTHLSKSNQNSHSLLFVWHKQLFPVIWISYLLNIFLNTLIPYYIMPFYRVRVLLWIIAKIVTRKMHCYLAFGCHQSWLQFFIVSWL